MCIRDSLGAFEGSLEAILAFLQAFMQPSWVILAVLEAIEAVLDRERGVLEPRSRRREMRPGPPGDLEL
eukprot:7217744-Pyramimonas_sp.AAC.1